MPATAEQLEPLPKLLTRILGHRPSPATIFRWTSTGLKVGDERVKLRALRIGAKLYGTEGDVREFIEAQNPPEPDADPQDGRDAATERRLQAAGLL